MIVWFETRTFVSNFGCSGKSGFKLGLKPKLKRHFMFRLNFGFKEFFFKFQTKVLNFGFNVMNICAKCH